jgi:microcystin degradation protein MlrC
MARRILIAGFKHETNTFSVLPTHLDAYRARCLYYGNDILQVFADTNSEITGFLDVCAKNNWAPVPSVVADASPSGIVTRNAYDAISRRILEDATSSSGVDGVLLQLHGAMVAEHTPDGEGYLLRMLREALGPSVPIGVTLDLHGNVTEDMARYADVIVSYRTYPHVDQREIATECATLIGKTLSGEIHPVCHVRRPPMLTGLDHGRTTALGPMREALHRAETLMNSLDVCSVSIMAGFSPADIPDAGPSVVIVADRANSDAAQKADEIVSYIWETRDVSTVELQSTQQAIAVAKEKGRPGAPVVIADFADNPGGGGYGDSTKLLRMLIESEIQNVAYGTLYDPHSAESCHLAGEGAVVRLSLGGKVEPQFGPPVDVEATVLKLTDGKFHLEGPMQAGVPIDMGQSALVETGGAQIVLASRRYQNFDQMYFKSFDVDLGKLSVIGVKSSQHFRAAYGAMASEVVVVDDGNGITTEDSRARHYGKLRSPVFPLHLA